MREIKNCESEQEAIKEVLKHFGINMEDLPCGGFSEFRNNNNNCRVYGIERIMKGRTGKKVRIIIDYDVDYPKAILRVFPNDNPLAILEEKEIRCPSM